VLLDRGAKLSQEGLIGKGIGREQTTFVGSGSSKSDVSEISDKCNPIIARTSWMERKTMDNDLLVCGLTDYRAEY
jgi:hypothetical protein